MVLGRARGSCQSPSPGGAGVGFAAAERLAGGSAAALAPHGPCAADGRGIGRSAAQRHAPLAVGPGPVDASHRAASGPERLAEPDRPPPDTPDGAHAIIKSTNKKI